MKGLEECLAHRKLSISGPYTYHYLSLCPWQMQPSPLTVHPPELCSSVSLCILVLLPGEAFPSSLPIQIPPILKGLAVHLLLQEAFFPNPPHPPLLGTPMTTLLCASSRAAGTGKYYYLRDVLKASLKDTYFKTRS